MARNDYEIYIYIHYVHIHLQPRTVGMYVGRPSRPVKRTAAGKGPDETVRTRGGVSKPMTQNNQAYDAEYRARAVSEMLGDVEAFEASDGGPDGAWEYKSLTVRRSKNSLHVFDVDGGLASIIRVADLPDGDDAHETLVSRLESINSETMAEL